MPLRAAINFSKVGFKTLCSHTWCRHYASEQTGKEGEHTGIHFKDNRFGVGNAFRTALAERLTLSQHRQGYLVFFRVYIIKRCGVWGHAIIMNCVGILQNQWEPETVCASTKTQRSIHTRNNYVHTFILRVVLVILSSRFTALCFVSWQPIWTWTQIDNNMGNIVNCICKRSPVCFKEETNRIQQINKGKIILLLCLGKRHLSYAVYITDELMFVLLDGVRFTPTIPNISDILRQQRSRRQSSIDLNYALLLNYTAVSFNIRIVVCSWSRFAPTSFDFSE